MPKIVQRKDGRYTTAVSVGGHRYFVYGQTQAEVREKLQRLLADAGRGVLVPPSHQTVGQFLDWWLASHEGNLKPSTASDYRDVIRLHLQPTIGQVKLEKLSPMHLTGLYTRKTKEGLSAYRVHRLHEILSVALGTAIRFELIGQNPCNKVDPPKRRHAETVVWTEEQASQFIEVELQGPVRWTWLWLTLLGTGARLGEMLGLTWKDVDFERRCLTIRRSITQVRGKIIVSAPKTASSTRTIALPEIAVVALREQSHLQADDRQQTGTVSFSDEDWVFTTESGRHPERSNLSRDFHRACARAQIPTVKIHSLRHLHTSLLIQSGGDFKTVQRRLGHADIRMTLATYSHLLNKSDVSLVEHLDRALNARKESNS